MGNFANWPRWIHACLAILALALSVAGLRAFPELSKLLSAPEKTVSVKSEKVESKLTDVRIVTETEEGTPLKGVSVRFSYRGSPTEKITTDDGYTQIKIPTTEDVEVTLSRGGYETRKHIINLKNDPGENRTYQMKKKLTKSTPNS